MQLQNVPIEAISKFNALGDIVPLKIRLEDDNHQLITASINEIVYAVENNFAGVKTFDYCCKAVIGGREQLLELRYHVANHKWIIRRVLY
ncbi:MAG: hypothetical protein K0S71_217 [Clostridia bacterium]|jgi:hypothetical protein|nr:hypothetical protein [Clostridia bacterium]